MRLWMFALAVRRLGKPHRRRRLIAAGTVIAYIRSQACRARFAVPWRQHRKWCVVDV